MKLIERIKAAQPLLVKPGPVVEVGELTFQPPETPITAKHNIPYALLDDTPLGVEEHFKNATLDQLHEDIVKGKPAQTAAQAGLLNTDLISKKMMEVLKASPVMTEALFPKKGNVDSFMAFPEPAKGGQVVGVWQVKLVAVEKDVYADTHRVVLVVTQGAEKGVTHTLTVGDMLTVNYKVFLG